MQDNKKAEHTEKSQLKPKRRRKSDMTTRNYICGCHKSYLSYAALYTHCKQKHNGVFPEGTVNLKKKRQGKAKDFNNSEQKMCKQLEDKLNFNKQFNYFIELIPEAKNDKHNDHRNLVEFFPGHLFSEQRDYEVLLINLERVKREMLGIYGPNFISQIDIIMYEINNVHQLNCNVVFTLFIIWVFRFVSKKFY